MADAMDMGDDMEEADDVYNQILGEIGMNMDDPNAVGSNQIASKIQKCSNKIRNKIVSYKMANKK